MTLIGIDRKGKAVETLVAVIAFVTVLYGPLWPVGRLALLNETDDKLAHDGIYNANAQRMFSWVALCILVLAVATFVAGGYYGYRWYAAALFAGILYVWLTCVVFEFEIVAAIKWLGSQRNAASIVFMFALAFVGIWVAIDKLGCRLINWCH